MQFKFKKTSLITLILLLLVGVVVKAGTMYTVTLDPVQIDAFPRVQLTFSINDNSLLGRDFLIKENSEDNTGPIVVLQPKATNNKIDLFLLIDKTGNTKKYEQVIKNNINALVVHMKNKGVDGKIYIQTLNNSDTPQNIQIDQFLLNDNGLTEYIENLSFNEEKKERTYGFEKIDNFAKFTARSGAEKVLIVINGSQFLDKDRGDTTTYALGTTINSLASNNFVVFALGNPIKQLHKSKTSIIDDALEDNSLSHALSGGYLGAFSSDLTQVYDLLFKRTSSKYALQYYSNKSANSASGTNVEIVIDNSSSKSFSYPSINQTKHEFMFTRADNIYIGTDANITAVVTPHEKSTNVLTVIYGGTDAGYKEKELMLDRENSNDEYSTYTGKLTTEDYEEYLNATSINYFGKLYSPDDVIDFGNGKIILIINYDAGIFLEGELVTANSSSQKILWKWSGETVDMGTEFELWGGDELIKKTTKLEFEVPINSSKCNRYQVMKLKVKLPEGADHPNAGGWSTFSLTAEKYMPAKISDGINEDDISETNGINLMLDCFDMSQSASNYTSSGSNKLSLDSSLKYLTDIKYEAQNNSINNRFIYILMKYISGETVKIMLNGEFKDIDGDSKVYLSEKDDIKREIVYKLITNTNQTNDFIDLYDKSLDEVLNRLTGGSSF